MNLSSSVVDGHFSLVTFLVGGGLLVPLGLFLIGEFLESGRDGTSNFSEAGIGVLSLDLGSGLDGVEEVGTHVALGGVGVLLLLLLATTGLFHGDVVLHLLLVTDLIGLSLLDPLLHFLFGELLVLLRQEAGTVVD